jgi:hypothetical protein
MQIVVCEGAPGKQAAILATASLRTPNLLFESTSWVHGKPSRNIARFHTVICLKKYENSPMEWRRMTALQIVNALPGAWFGGNLRRF